MDPQATINHLEGIDYRLLEQLDFLSRLRARRSPTGAAYANPSQAWLGTKLAVTRETISHHVGKLTRLGVVNTLHRRRVNGHWQTNLYRIVNRAWWRVHKISHLWRTALHHVKPASHIASPKKGSSSIFGDHLDPEVAKQLFSDLYKSLDLRKKPKGI